MNENELNKKQAIKEIIKRIIPIECELKAITLLYADFKTLNITKCILRNELRILREELKAELSELTDKLNNL